MQFDYFIGIDPGKQGGIAVIGNGVSVIRMPKFETKEPTFAKMRVLLEQLKVDYPNSLVFVESVQSYLGDVSEGGKIFNIIKMIKGYIELKTILKMLDFTVIDVTPKMWQNRMNLSVKESSQDKKNRIKTFAQAVCPEIKVTLWNADAITIAMFGRNQWIEQTKWMKEKMRKKVVLTLL